MHPNEAIIKAFYEAFNERDYAGMNKHYHADAQFSDPAFPGLNGKQVRAMWHMLCERGKDLKITAKAIEANDISGSCRWEAHYSFSATGRKVHNIIEADFTFRDGKILTHTDRFNLHRWMGQALGLKGTLFGWLGSAQEKVRQTAAKSLRNFISEHTEYK